MGQETPLTDDERVLARFRARYAAQDRLSAGLSLLTKYAAAPFPRSKVTFPPSKILVADAGNIGDVIMATAIIDPLQSLYPNCKIDFLVRPSTKQVLEGRDLVSKIHVLDHWAGGAQSAGSRSSRAREYYFRAFRGALAEIKSSEYDISIDLRPWFPNYVPLLWRANIPVRVGFDRLGLGPLLSHRAPFIYDRRHEVTHKLELLRLLGASQADLDRAKPNSAPVNSSPLWEALTDSLPRPYHVLHPASSTPLKDWPIGNWAALANTLLARGVTPVLTGRGVRDSAMSEEIERVAPGVVSLVGKLTWAELTAVLSEAELVYSVDTAVGHLAGALGRPVVSIYGGMADHVRWAPVGAAVATYRLPCSPCFQKNGCEQRRCIQQVSVDQVLETAGAVVLSPPI